MKKLQDYLWEVPAVAQVLSKLTAISVSAADNDGRHAYGVLVLKGGIHLLQ